MNKTEWIEKTAEKSGTTKVETKKLLENALEVITAELATGENVMLFGFGTFESRNRAARSGKNPRTGEIINISAAVVPFFKAGKNLKIAVNKK